MQLCNLTLRLGGSMLHTVPKTDVTPAEILILQTLHGPDAVVDIRPTKMANTRQDAEWERLARLYDQGSGGSMPAPGEETRGLMERLFPGIIKKLPVSLKEIGMGHLMSPASIRAAEAAAAAAKPDLPPIGETGEVELLPAEPEA